MARGDEIMQSFLKHRIIREKYGLSDKDLPKKVHEGLKSSIPIVKVIALIIKDRDGATPSSYKKLYSDITKYLNYEIL